jgi:hypothetical protein
LADLASLSYISIMRGDHGSSSGPHDPAQARDDGPARARLP